MRTRVETKPNAVMTFHFEDDRIVFVDVSTDGVPSCGDTPGVYEIHLLKNRNIKFVLIEDRCSPRVRTTALEHVRFQMTP